MPIGNRFDRFLEDDAEPDPVAPPAAASGRSIFHDIVDAEPVAAPKPKPSLWDRAKETASGIYDIAKTGGQALMEGVNAVESAPSEAAAFYASGGQWDDTAERRADMGIGRLARAATGALPEYGGEDEIWKNARATQGDSASGGVPGETVQQAYERLKQQKAMSPYDWNPYAEEAVGQGIGLAAEFETSPLMGALKLGAPDLVHRGVGLAFAPGMLTAAGEETGQGISDVEQHGMNPEAFGKLMSGATHGAFGLLGVHAGLKPGEAPPRQRPRIEPFERTEPVSQRRAPESLSEVEAQPETTPLGINEAFPEEGSIAESFPEVPGRKGGKPIERPFFGEPDEPFAETPAQPSVFEQILNESITSPTEPRLAGTATLADLPGGEMVRMSPAAEAASGTEATPIPERENRARALRDARRLDRKQNEADSASLEEVLQNRGLRNEGTYSPLAPEVPEGWTVDAGPEKGDFVVVDPEGTVREVLPNRESAVRRSNELASEGGAAFPEIPPERPAAPLQERTVTPEEPAFFTEERRGAGEGRRGPDRRYMRRWAEEHPEATREEVADEGQRHAETDWLTGLKNKGGWQRLLEEKSPDDHVVYVDLKKFKPINDALGEAAGDEALAHVGEIVRRHFGDDSARQGGDEFGAVLRGVASPEEAQARAEAFRQELSKSGRTFRNKETGKQIEIPGFEAHIGVGLDAAKANAAEGRAAKATYEAAGERRRGEGPAPEDQGRPAPEVPEVPERPGVGTGGRLEEVAGAEALAGPKESVRPRSAEAGFVATDLPRALAEGIVKLGHEAGKVATRAYELAKSGVKSAAEFAGRMVKEFGEGIGRHIDALWDWATDAVEHLAEKYPRVATGIGEALGGVEAVASKATAAPLRPVRPIPPKGAAAPTPTKDYYTPEASKIEAADRAATDRFADFERMTKTVRARGGVAPEVMTADPVMAARVAGSKKAARIEEMQQKFGEPIINMARKAGISWGEASDYVMAKHAPEANRELLRRNAMGHSGMSDSQAAQTIAKAQASGKIKTYERIAQQVQKLNEWKLDLAEKSGRYSPEQIKQFKTSWGDWWVPTRDDAIMPDNSIFRESPSLPRGFDVRRKLQARTGRGTRAIDPLAAAFVDAQNIVIASENNQVSRSLAELHKNNPQLLDLAEPVAPMATRLGKDGKVHQVRDTSALRNDPTVLFYYENGAEKALQFKHPNPDQAAYYAAAFKDMGRDDVGPISEGIGKFTKFIAAMSTRHNPAFAVVRNPINDYFGAIPAATIEHGADVGAAVAKRLLPGGGLRRSIYREIMETGSTNPEFRDYVNRGAKISNYKFQDIEDMGTAMRKAVNAGNARQIAKRVGKVTGAMNDAMESATRFALYQELVSRGVSKDKAIIHSRNITLDFDKRGLSGGELRAWYPFLNAHIQGGRRIIKLAVDHPRRFATVATGLVALGFAQDSFNRMMAGDKDGDGLNDYDQMPSWAKANNLVIGHVMVPWRDFAFLHGIGTTLGELTHGVISKKEAALNIGLNLQQAFNPLGGQGGKGDTVKNLVITGTPSPLRPLTEIATNQNQLGSPIRPEQPKFGSKKKNVDLAFKSVNPFAKAVARAVEGWTGFDRSPEDYEQIFQDYLGGAGRTASLALKTIGHLASGEAPPPRETPVLSSLYYQPHPSEQSRRYYETLDEINDAALKAKELRKERKGDEAKVLESGILRARGAFDAAHARLKSLHEAKARAEKNGADTTMIDQSIEATMRKANKTYQEARKRAGLPDLREAK